MFISIINYSVVIHLHHHSDGTAEGCKKHCHTFRRVILKISVVGGAVVILIKLVDVFLVKMTMLGLVFYWMQVVTLGGFMLGISLEQLSYSED